MKIGTSTGNLRVLLVERLFQGSIGAMMLQQPNGVASMQHVRPAFDDAAFFEALERRRQAEGMSWRQLGRRLDLSPSTFSRLGRGKRPEVETFIKLLAWLDVPAAAFMQGEPMSSPGSSERDTLSVIAAALQSDPSISRDAAGALEQLMRVAYSQVRTNVDSEPSTADTSAKSEDDE